MKWRTFSLSLFLLIGLGACEPDNTEPLDCDALQEEFAGAEIQWTDSTLDESSHSMCFAGDAFLQFMNSANDDEGEDDEGDVESDETSQCEPVISEGAAWECTMRMDCALDADVVFAADLHFKRDGSFDGDLSIVSTESTELPDGGNTIDCAYAIEGALVNN